MATFLPDFVGLNLIGESLAFRHALSVITRVAACDATVLIQGETGTGKELAARAIHYLGSRRDFPFIPVNCGAIPDSLVENELFGHVRGAYTGAADGQPGLVAEAEGGTLFLDEVETLSARAQVTLLRFLQDGTFRRLGGRGDVHGNVRIVAATNAHLGELAERESFRRDLLYRLMVMSLALPPLRDRAADAEILAAHFIRRFSQQYSRGHRALDAAFVTYLQTHRWPGNVRGLENLVHRQYLMTDTGTIMPPDGHEGDAAVLRPDRSGAAVVYSHFQLGFNAARAATVDAFERSFVAWALRESVRRQTRLDRSAPFLRDTFERIVA